MAKRALTAKQLAFVECYCDPMSETYNNQRQSAKKAGYSKNTGIAACQNIIAKPSVMQAMGDYKAKLRLKQVVTVEYIQQEHQRLADLAEEKGDLATATRNKEGLARTIAAYTDKYQDASDTDHPALSEIERRRLQLMAQNLLKDKATG